MLIDGVRVAVTKLVAPEQYLGALELKVNRDGAAVLVDGRKVGVTPLAAMGGLKPGEHELRVEIQDADPFVQPINIYLARTTMVNITVTGTEVEATVETTVVQALPPPLPPPIEDETADEQGLPWGSPTFVSGVVLGGGGVAVLAVSGIGLAFYAVSLSDMGDITSDQTCPAGPCTVVDDTGRYDTLYEQAAFSWNLAIISGVIGDTPSQSSGATGWPQRNEVAADHVVAQAATVRCST